MGLLTDRYTTLNKQTFVSIQLLHFYAKITPSPLTKYIVTNTNLAKESDGWDSHKAWDKAKF